MPSPFISVICFREEGVIFSLSGQRNKEAKKNKKNNAWSQVRPWKACAAGVRKGRGRETPATQARLWTSHRPLLSATHANISKAMWRTKRHIAFCACVCPFAYTYAPVKTRITDSTNYRICVSNFLSSWLVNRQWLSWQTNHGAYTGGGLEQGFWPVFADGLISSVAQARMFTIPHFSVRYRQDRPLTGQAAILVSFVPRGRASGFITVGVA